MDDNALARKAMHIQRDMFMRKQKCWMSDFHTTLTATAYGREIWDRWNAVENFRVPCVRVTLNKDGKVETEDWHAIMKQEFTTAAEEEWLADINRPNAKRGAGGNKLRTYAMFKSECKQEVYLQCVDQQAKWRLMSRFRMGVAPLRIEQGRYEANGRNDGSTGIPSEQRICQVCEGGIEDELHLFMKCPAYSTRRQRMLTKVHGVQKDLVVGDDVVVFKKLMSTNAGEAVGHVVNYVWEAFKERRIKLKDKGIVMV